MRVLHPMKGSLHVLGLLQQRFRLVQVDVRTAFLNSELTENIHMEPLTGFVVRDDLSVKRHSNKAINGLKQAGRAWQEVATIVKKRLVCMGSNMSEADKCLYLKKKLFWTYFTWMIRLIAATTIAGCYQVIDVLKEDWFVRVIGEPNTF
jgi:hypothetical protein